MLPLALDGLARRCVFEDCNARIKDQLRCWFNSQLGGPRGFACPWQLFIFLLLSFIKLHLQFGRYIVFACM